MTEKQRQTETSPAPDRRQVLTGSGALLMRTAFPVAALTAGFAVRPDGWILLERDRDVS